MNHINSIVEKIITLTKSDEIKEANFGGTMIYQVGYSMLGYQRVSQCDAAAPDCLYIFASHALHNQEEVFFI